MISRMNQSPGTAEQAVVNEECEGRVEAVAGRYPFRPVCTCGQEFRGYVAEHAAQIVIDNHVNPKPYEHIRFSA